VHAKVMFVPISSVLAQPSCRYWSYETAACCEVEVFGGAVLLLTEVSDGVGRL